MVRDGMSSAIDLAQAASDTMQALKDQTHSEAQMDLFGYMFSFAVKKVDGRRQVDPSAWTWITRIFVQTLKLKPLRDEKLVEDVVIYCDYSQYIEGTQCNGNEIKKMACDKDTSEDVDINSAFKWCKSKSGYFPVMGLTSSNGVSNFSQMVLCVWYSKFMTTPKKQYWSDLGSKSLLAWPIHKIYNVTLLRTKMDAAALLDHTILHELTHAISLRATTDTSNLFSYGLKRCVSPGKSRDSGINNADNYAYFALGARMINPNNGKAPMRPMKNESIKPLSNQNQGRSIPAQAEPEIESTHSKYTSSATFIERSSVHETNKDLTNKPTRTVGQTTFTA